MRFTIAPFALAASALALAALAPAARAAALEVPLDHSLRLPVRGAGSVVLGNSGVADVTVVDANTVYLMGRSYGSTDIVVLDRAGRPVFSGEITVIRPPTDVAVFRGAERTEYACAGSCAKSEHGGESGGGAPAPAGH